MLPQVSGSPGDYTISHGFAREALSNGAKGSSGSMVLGELTEFDEHPV